MPTECSAERNYRRQDLIEQAVETLVEQRVFAIALGYEDLNASRPSIRRLAAASAEVRNWFLVKHDASRPKEHGGLHLAGTILVL